MNIYQKIIHYLRCMKYSFFKCEDCRKRMWMKRIKDYHDGAILWFCSDKCLHKSI